MGNYVSKFFFYVTESKKENDEVQPVVQQVATLQDDNVCTPLMNRKKVLEDPRSVTVGIPRTPIEVNCTPVGVSKRPPNAIPRYLQTKQYLETDMDVVMPPLTPKKHSIAKLIDNDQSPGLNEITQDYLTSNINVAKGPRVITSIDKARYKILGLDPRSPAADFDRTPILMPRSLALIKARSQENLSRRGSYEADIHNPRNSYQEMSTPVNHTKVQLLPNIAAEGLKTLDSGKRIELNMPRISFSDTDSSASEDDEQITVITNPRYKSSIDKSLILDGWTSVCDEESADTNKQYVSEDIEQNIKTVRIRDNDHIKIWHDSLSSEKHILDEIDKKENEDKSSREKALREDVIIIFDEDVTKDTSLLKAVKTEEISQQKRIITKRKNKSCKTEVKLKLVEKNIFSPDNKYGNEIPKNRTPLGNRSNDNCQRQGVSPQLLRNKAIAGKIQQENTPPHKKYTAKAKNGMQWDPNSTIII